MKGEKLLEEMEHVDPELLKEAEGYQVNRARQKKQLVTIIAAAAAVVLTVGAVGLGVGMNLRQREGNGTGQEESVSPAGETGTADGTADQEGNGSEHGESWETRVSSQEETLPEAETELWREKSWEEKTLPERFREFDYQGAQYSLRAAAEASRAGEKLADVTLRGEDPYTGSLYETTGEVFRLNGFSEKTAVVLRFNESGEQFVAMSPDYRPATLGAFLLEANAEELITVPGKAYYRYYDAENRVHTVTFEGVTKEAVLSWLRENAAAEGVDFDSVMNLPENVVSYINCGVSAADFERINVSLNFTKSGYVWTNLFDVGLSFHVGEEAVQQFEQYLKTNLQGYEYVQEADPEAGTTEDMGAESGFETSPQTEGAETVEE